MHPGSIAGPIRPIGPIDWTYRSRHTNSHTPTPIVRLVRRRRARSRGLSPYFSTVGSSNFRSCGQFTHTRTFSDPTCGIILQAHDQALQIYGILGQKSILFNRKFSTFCLLCRGLLLVTCLGIRAQDRFKTPRPR